MKCMFSLQNHIHGVDAPIMFKWQSTLGNYLATTGPDFVVRIWDRHGQLTEELQLPGMCNGMEWDMDGDTLCTICDKSSMLFMWDAAQRKVIKIDSGSKEVVTFLAWSKLEFYLAIGTAKGNLILYNHKVGRKVPILGKHSKKIVCGSWSSSSNYLGLGGDDKVVTVSDTSGQTLHQFSVNEKPSQLQFSEMKGMAKSRGIDNTVSLVVGKKTLFLYNLQEPDESSQLAFQPKYGKIEQYCWYGDSYIMIGFSHGHLVAISTHPHEIGREIFHVRNHNDYLSSIAVSRALNYAATCGDSSVHIHDLMKLEEVNAIINLEEERGLKDLAWTADGQLLAVSTMHGKLHCYLTKLPMLGDTWGTKMTYLTSLLEVTVWNIMEGEAPVVKAIDVEPSFLACGPFHLAVGMNNRAWFYLLNGDSNKTTDREYLGTVQHMSLNGDYAAVLFDGKVQLHMIEHGMQAGVDGRETKLFSGDETRVTCVHLTNDFLIYGTESGNVCYFFVEDWSEVNVYRHGVGIRSVYPNSTGTHTAFIDEKGDGVIYNPVNDSVHQIPELPANIHSLLWESYLFDKDVFAVFDDETAYTYVFHRETIQGPRVTLACSTRIPFAQRPLLLHNGTLTLQLPSGKLNSLLLDSHSFLNMGQDDLPDMQTREVWLDCAIALRRWKEGYAVAVAIDTVDAWRKLAEAALHALDIDLAIRVYRHLGNAGMVLSLEKLRNVEDSNLLAGTLASYVGRFDMAQDLLLASTYPVAALNMRRDLMNWDTAMQLATSLDPTQIPFIAKEYAIQLEFTGNYTAAYAHFEKGIVRLSEHREHDEACAAGLARTAIRLGNLRKGVEIAIKHPSRQLKKECAAILEGMRQFAESAALYERGEYWDKAATVYIRGKNWPRVGELLPKITTIRIHMQYAKAKEADKQYAEAADAYHNAKDYDSEIRVCLDYLRDPERAVSVVKTTGSTDGAKMVANFFIKLGDYASAIQFLVLSKCNDEAFHMAKEHGQMMVYADIVGDKATPDDLKSIALHFEDETNHMMAGKFFGLCGEYKKALNHYMRCSLADPESAEQVLAGAVETVAAAQDVQLTRQLTDYLLGEHDGVPKDANYLFKMYMALGQYGEAAHTAVIISKEEQNNANYRRAHDLLFGMLKELKARQIKVPAEMESNLMILHSYILVKSHIRRDDHTRAARLLVRVAENISKFPKHIVPILTSTVIECHKSGLRQSSFSYAAMLMRPEYRNKIDPKLKKKIEQIVRKTGNQGEDEEEATSPCPYCNSELTDSQLVCSGCRNNIPYCIATGRHIVRNNLTTCPKCEFPALLSEFRTFLQAEPTCPMCSRSVDLDNLSRIKNIDPILNLN